MQSEMFTRSLRCPLTEAEQLERAQRIARLVTSTAEMRDALKSEVAGRKAVIAEKEGELGRLSTEVRDRATFRDIDCERSFDYRAGEVTESRLDTGETLSTRAMTYAERQLELDMPDADEPGNGDSEGAYDDTGPDVDTSAHEGEAIPGDDSDPPSAPTPRARKPKPTRSPAPKGRVRRAR